MFHRGWQFGGVWIYLCVCVCQFGTDNEDLVGTKRHIRGTVLALRAHSQRHQTQARRCLAKTAQPGPGECFLAGWLPRRLTGWVAACRINWMGSSTCRNITHTVYVLKSVNWLLGFVCVLGVCGCVWVTAGWRRTVVCSRLKVNHVGQLTAGLSVGVSPWWCSATTGAFNQQPITLHSLCVWSISCKMLTCTIWTVCCLLCINMHDEVFKYVNRELICMTEKQLELTKWKP